MIEGQPMSSSGSGNSIDGVLNKSLTVKNILIGAGVLALVWYIYKQNKDKAYTSAMIEVSKNPVQLGSQGAGISTDKLNLIRDNIHNYIVALNTKMNDAEIEETVYRLTTV